MPLSTRIAPHSLSSALRPSVTGSQAAGDAYVSAVLEALIDDLRLFPPGVERSASVFTSCSVPVRKTQDRPTQLASPFAWEQKAASNLSLIAPPQRQAFLLVALRVSRPARLRNHGAGPRRLRQAADQRLGGDFAPDRDRRDASSRMSLSSRWTSRNGDEPRSPGHGIARTPPSA